MTLVPLEVAKTHLGITDPARDAEVALKLAHASFLVVRRLDTRAEPTWDETTAPDDVQAATLSVLAHLWEHRGDDMAPDDHAEAVWNAVKLYLSHRIKPVLA